MGGTDEKERFGRVNLRWRAKQRVDKRSLCEGPCDASDATPTDSTINWA